MIKNKGPKLSFSISLVIAMLFHLVILFFVKKSTLDITTINPNAFKPPHPLKIDRIELISPNELQRMKKVGIKNGAKKDYLQPDILKIAKPAASTPPGLSLGSLAPDLPAPKESKDSKDSKETKESKKAKNKTAFKKEQIPSRELTDTIPRPMEDEAGHIYFNPKKEKQIPRDRDQDNLKQEAFKNIPTSTSNPIAQKMSNFEIRYERPEGVSEDELNSDEKAYYSFFKRSYANYLTKLYATYEKVSVERPGLEKDFANKHLLIGRIDYDDKGNIILVKILKSSESDNIHYFFEETLKQLNLPNPPKSFIKSKKQFTTYYQIQIN
ncbi:MAG: hypothetical protein PHY93_00670 [Bacteriovorax sp.]|nr:hypothetical protein [Bacteriovorax sp.]